MKKFLLSMLIVCALLTAVSCDKDEQKKAEAKPPLIYNQSDTVKQKAIQSTYTLVTFDKINQNGECRVSNWLCTSTNDKTFDFKEREGATDKIYVGAGTEILMGNIMSYDGSYPLDMYSKSTNYDYFIKNAAKEYDGKKLYFKVTLKENSTKKGYAEAEKIELFWKYYFKNA